MASPSWHLGKNGSNQLPGSLDVFIVVVGLVAVRQLPPLVAEQRVHEALDQPQVCLMQGVGEGEAKAVLQVAEERQRRLQRQKALSR